jgi:hypothetical protein
MIYITVETNKKEELVAVAGGKDEAEYIRDCIRDGVRTRSLTQLLNNKVEIPPALKWIVESDRKHQEREIEGRTKNLCGLDYGPKPESIKNKEKRDQQIAGEMGWENEGGAIK